MSSIGLYDWDLLTWSQPILFNLDLMKIAAYMKHRRHLVKMLQEIDLQRYNYIYISKNYEDDYYPKNIFNNEKVKLIGDVITEDISNIPEDIDSITPDSTIYERLGKYYNINQLYTKWYSSMLKGVHIRLSRNGKDIWDNYESQLKNYDLRKHSTLYIHDKDINKIQGAFSEIERVKSNMMYTGSYLYIRSPLIISNEEDFIKWSKIYRQNMSSNNIINAELPLELLIKEIPTKRQRFEYDLDSFIPTTNNLIEAIPSLYRLAVFYGANRSEMLLKKTPKKEDDSQWLILLDMLNEYFSIYSITKAKERKTFFQYCKSSNYLREDLIQLFTIVKNDCPELFDLFYNCRGVVEINNKLYEIFDI